MNTRRWLSVAAITVASATLALAGAGSDALASNIAATGQIKACYKTGTALVPLGHVGNSVACPAGDSTLTWNMVGPQGRRGPRGPGRPGGRGLRDQRYEHSAGPGPSSDTGAVLHRCDGRR